ncbi:hypothetical protein MNV49_000089 [Pseudohyphozyma bogoriensis]|nr:hypothetical protein MNV49_000089 [Pseudohyphozyma bogoriensis]
MSVSYGASLPDSAHIVGQRCDNILQLFPTLSAFVNIRVGLEREYAKKLSEAASKARSQAIKDSADRVGSSKASNTLEEGLMKLIESADLDAREHLAFAEALNAGVVNAMSSSGAKLDTIRKKHVAFNGKLLSERDRAEHERDKAKQKYFEACDSLESARQKKAQAKDERGTEKATRAYEMAMDDMLVSKNAYLLHLDVANVAKGRLYNTDLPALHDDFQLLEASSITQLVFILDKLTQVMRHSLGRLGDNVGIIETAVRAVDVDADQASFVEAHSAGKLASWEVPRDTEFEPSPIWNDTADMSVTEAGEVYLTNVKLKSMSKLAEMTPMIESKKREISGLRNLVQAYEKDRGLGDAAAVIENLFDSTRDTTLSEINATELRAQVELINATLGDEGAPTLKLHDFKNSSFVTPATCVVCESSIWGKGRQCKACGCAVHAKCELKVPAGCGTSSGLQRNKSRRMSSTSKTASISRTTPPSSTVASPTLGTGPPRKTMPPPPTEAAQPTHEETATLLYSYDAATAFELTVSEGDVVSIVAPEDESGWIKVRTSDSRVGLIPASYVQLGGAMGETGGAAAVEEADEDGQEVVALYDYDAAGSDELSLKEGDRLTLTPTGMDAGDGWAEAKLNGRVGLVPSSYIQLF